VRSSAGRVSRLARTCEEIVRDDMSEVVEASLSSVRTLTSLAQG
jgi:hypothetical protein